MTARTRPQAGQRSTVSIVRTAPLLADQIVTTVSAKGAASLRSPELVFVTTSSSEIEMLRTDTRATETLNDEQLLELFKGRPVALVFVGPNERRLVLLDEEQKP